MRHRGTSLVIFWITALTCPLVPLAGQASPYSELTVRSIKALAPETIAALRSGDGMGYALAAELNHYPGPRHVLELGDSLALTAEQVISIETVYSTMQVAAQRIGGELVTAEARLDSVFASATASEAGVEAAVTAVGRLDSQLRFVHLAAHVRVRALLSQHQRVEYDRLRGYGADHEHEHRD